jgi:prepilin-type N-terminal cleavage/methylation domain-containing protein
MSEHSGFTLIELLVALLITGMVVSLAGIGLVSISRGSERERQEANDRLELDRAMGFILEEVKMSKSIDPDPVTISGFKPTSSGSNIKPILALNPASNSGLKDPIVYYTIDPDVKSIWQGPRSIYRWGPTLMADGSYSDGDGKSLADSTKGSVEYFNELLIDRIGEHSPTTTKQISPGLILECDSKTETAVPNNINHREGFYLCLDDSNRSVKIWMHRQPTELTNPQFTIGTAITRSR